MRTVNIETKSTAEVVIPTPHYCKIESKYLTKYIYFTDKTIMEICPNSIYSNTFNEYNEIFAARDYMDSIQITREEFIENYNKIINKLNSAI